MVGYVFTHGGQQFAPEGRVQLDDPAEHNRELERVALAYWQTKPNTFAAYVTLEDGPVRHYKVGTWLGSSLGQIVEMRRHRNNLTGSSMQYVKVRGNNGATYSGTYGHEWSQLVRLRRIKG